LLFAAVGLLIVTSPAIALERTEHISQPGLEARNWSTGTSCVVSYWNNCTGWVWVWGPYADQDVAGTIFEPCCGNARLEQSRWYIWTGVNPGYGYTGSIEISTADENGCPDVQIAQQAYVPRSGWSTSVWGVDVSGPVVVTATFSVLSVFSDEVTLPSDHPAAGSTGPQSCGFCYPSTRPTRSHYYGNLVSGRSCPGIPLDDGVCNAEYLHEATFTCTVPVKSSSWGEIKKLYR